MRVPIPALRWERKPSLPCPCGSGRQFHKCCQANKDLIGKAKEFARIKEYEAAEKAWRAELTRYIGWVFQHTLILHKYPPGPLAKLPTIDVNALHEFAENIAWALEKQGKRENILHTFDNLTQTVPLPGLKERMTYSKCLWLSGPLNEKQQASTLLEEWPTHNKIRDPQLLQIWFEFRARTLSPLKRIEVLNRMIQLSTPPTQKLQYALARTFQLILLGDNEEAKRSHTEAMNSYLPSAVEATDDGDFYAASVCAGALELQGMFNNDNVAFDRALGFLEKVDVADLTTKGAAKLSYDKGKLWLLKKEPAQAVAYFTESYQYDPDVLALIHRLDAYVQSDDLKSAKQELQRLRSQQVPDKFMLEFLGNAAGLVVKAGDAKEAVKLVSELKALALDEMHFRGQRDELCIELLEFVSQESKKATTPAKRQSIWQKIQTISEYFELKPTVFGFGVNLNRFLEPKKKETPSE